MKQRRAKDISITAGKTTTIDYYRYNPYVDKLYAEKDSVEANTPVKINVSIKVPSNCPDAKAYVKALVIIKDESGYEVYRKMSDDREVQKGDSTTFSFSYTPAKEGTYSGLAKAYIVGGGELCTDNCGWVKVFEVKKELPTSPRVKVITSDWKYPIDWIETGSKKTINWLALDDKGVVSIDIYWIDQDMPNTPILIVKGTKNNGEYLWDTTSMEGFYKIMVVAFDADGNWGKGVSSGLIGIYKGFKSDFQLTRDAYSFPESAIGPVCYGMSSTCVRYFNYRHNYSPAEEPPEPSKSTYELKATPEVVRRIKDRANVSYWDFIRNIRNGKLYTGIHVNQIEEYEKIKDKLALGQPVIIGLALFNNGKYKPHTVVAYDMHKIKDDVLIYVYEPNRPGKEKLNFIDYDRGEDTLYYSYFINEHLDRFIAMDA